MAGDAARVGTRIRFGAILLRSSLVSTSDPVLNVLLITCGWLGFLALGIFGLPVLLVWGVACAALCGLGFLAGEVYLHFAPVSPTAGILLPLIPAASAWCISRKNRRKIVSKSLHFVFFLFPEIWAETLLGFINIQTVPDLGAHLSRFWKRRAGDVGGMLMERRLIASDLSLREPAARVAALVGINGVPTFLEDYDGWFGEVRRRIQMRSFAEVSRNEASLLLDQAVQAYAKLVALKRSQGELELLPLEGEVAREELLLKLERARAERHGEEFKGEQHKAAIRALQPAAPKSLNEKRAEWVREIEAALTGRANQLESLAKLGERLKRKVPLPSRGH